MKYPHQPENIKACPECGTNLINTARRCAVCGYRFEDASLAPAKRKGSAKGPRLLFPITITLPFLLGLLLLLVAVNSLVILGFQKRDQTEIMLAAAQATSTYIATTYVSPTPSPTLTFTPAPPTETPIVDIEYTVVEGDSCLSICTRFNLYLDSLLRKNDIDCAALKIGTVLQIPQPTATPEPTKTKESAAVP
jgi:hypothetical protein